MPPFFDRRLVKRQTRVLGPASVLSGMRIRKKLVVLHTLFSLVLAAILLVAIRPAMNEVVDQAEGVLFIHLLLMIQEHLD